MKTLKRLKSNAAHRRLTKIGVPRKKDGNRLGLRKRNAIAAKAGVA